MGALQVAQGALHDPEIFEDWPAVAVPLGVDVPAVLPFGAKELQAVGMLANRGHHKKKAQTRKSAPFPRQSYALAACLRYCCNMCSI